jgi:hypothetical protein
VASCSWRFRGVRGVEANEWMYRKPPKPLQGKPQPLHRIGYFRTTNILQHQFQIGFLQRYWMTTASRCGEPHNDSPHLQRCEPHPASPRRIGSYSGTVRRGNAPVPHVKHWPTTERRALRTTSLDEPSHSLLFYSQTRIWPPYLPQFAPFRHCRAPRKPMEDMPIPQPSREATTPVPLPGLGRLACICEIGPMGQVFRLHGLICRHRLVSNKTVESSTHRSPSHTRDLFTSQPCKIVWLCWTSWRQHRPTSSTQKSRKYQLLRLLAHQLASSKPLCTNGETDTTSR